MPTEKRADFRSLEQEASQANVKNKLKIRALPYSCEQLTDQKLHVCSFLQYKSKKAHNSAAGAWSWKCEVR